MPERENAALTKRQREYLHGNGYESADAERMARKRLRTRVRNSIRDFAILQENLSRKDRKMVFDGWRGSDLEDGLAAMLEFCYQGVNKHEFEKRLLQNAVYRVEHERNPLVYGANVQIGIEQRSMPETEESRLDMVEQFIESSELSKEEVLDRLSSSDES